MADREYERPLASSLATGGNTVLAQLTASDLASIGEIAERRSFGRGEVLGAADEISHCVYFVEEGIVSVVRPGGNGRRIEVCLIGFDGIIGSAVFQGDSRSPYETFVQSDRVVAICANASAIRRLFDESFDFRATIMRSLYVQTVQIAENLVSAASQTIQARLARWLLMYHDRSASAFLELTHEFMAEMIGAQRARVTVALHELEALGAISASRGRIVLKERATLIRLADGTYGCAEREAARLHRAAVPLSAI